MSYDISLMATIDSHGFHGDTLSEFNVTFNYFEVTKLFDFNFQDLSGMTGRDSMFVLAALLGKLKSVRVTSDKWAPTPGNVGAVVQELLLESIRFPRAVWKVT